jgi:hypothetical protein
MSKLKEMISVILKQAKPCDQYDTNVQFFYKPVLINHLKGNGIDANKTQVTEVLKVLGFKEVIRKMSGKSMRVFPYKAVDYEGNKTKPMSSKV